YTEIVLGVLEVIFRHYRVPARLGIARQLQVFLGNVGGIAAHLHVGAIALVAPGKRIDVLAPAVTAPLPVLVLVVGSHLVVLLTSNRSNVVADRLPAGPAIHLGRAQGHRARPTGFMKT